MGTSATSLGTSSSGVPTFNGSSQYASQLQEVITNAVNAASEPITALQNEQTTLTNQSNEVSTMETDFNALQTAVQGIQNAIGGSSLSADVSDPSVVSASVSDGATPGSYSIQVNNIGSYSTTLTNTWTGTASGSPDTYVLSVGSQTYNIKPTDNSATSVASAINAQSDGAVQATVVNVGSNSSPDYRISLQSTALTSDTIDLTNNGSSTSAVQTAGAPAEYEINNSGNVVSSDSRTVDIATGVTLNLLSGSDGPVSIDVSQSTSALSDALSTFVSAYNTAQTEVLHQRGQNAGPLQASELVDQLQQVLSGLSTYSSLNGSTTVGSLSDLGITMNDDGSLSFDGGAALESAESSDPSAVSAFLGSATTGGFLESATKALTGVSDPTTGILATTQTDYQNEISSIGTQISNKQAQVSQLQTSLTNQMNSADALINSLEQQYTYLSDVLQSQQIDDEAYHGD